MFFPCVYTILLIGEVQALFFSVEYYFFPVYLRILGA